MNNFSFFLVHKSKFKSKKLIMELWARSFSELLYAILVYLSWTYIFLDIWLLECMFIGMVILPLVHALFLLVCACIYIPYFSGVFRYLSISVPFKKNGGWSSCWCNWSSQYWRAWDPDDSENFPFCWSCKHEYPLFDRVVYFDNH